MQISDNSYDQIQREEAVFTLASTEAVDGGPGVRTDRIKV